MGLHRCRIWRFVLSIALFIAVVQIVTTLYFTSYFNGDGSHESARINGDVKTTPFSDISTSKSVETTAVSDIRKSKATDLVLKILSKHKDFDCVLTHKDAQSAFSRAKSSECRKIIHKTGCILQNHRLYTHQTLERSCPLEKGKSDFPRAVTDGVAKGPPARVVFLLSVHGRAIRQVKRLLKAIYHKNHYYYFHVDKRSNYLYRELVEIAAELPNVMVAPWRMATIWGGSSLLQMLLKAMEDMVRDDLKWDFLINLSESDYPIKSNKFLTEFLTAHKDDNFLKSHGREPGRFIHKQGLDRTFVECDEHMWRIGDRSLPSKLEIDGGSDWIGLNRKFVEYIVKSDDRLVVELKNMYAFALLPAESFFHSLLRNGPFCETFVKTNLRITNWKRKLGCRCQYKHIVDWCGCSPNDFKPEDMPRLKQSQQDLFARKFEAIVNQKVINLLEEHLFGEFPSGMQALDTYWENSHHHLDGNRLSDTLRTYFTSFSRLATKYVSNRHCQNAPIGQFKEITYIKVDDEFSGMLLLQDVSLRQGRSVTMETWFSRADREQMMNLNMGEAPSRLTGLQVGTSWDEKERIFRNYGRLMGPYDDPVLVHYWKKGKTMKVKLMWIDPVAIVTGVYEMQVGDDWIVSFHKPTYAKPLRPGMWSIKMIYREEGGKDLVIGQTNFLVLPLAYSNGVPVNVTQAVAFNNGPPSGRYTSQYSIEFDREAKDIDNLAEIASQNSKKTGAELNDWVDTLLKEHWSVEDACVVGSELPVCQGLAQCEATLWSSRSPDPKSEIGKVNVNGTLK